MNFGALYAFVRDRAGLSTNQTQLAKDVVNMAAHQFYTARLWSFLQSTKDVTLASGTQEYVLAGASSVVNDYASIISVGCNFGTSGNDAARFRDLVEYDQQLFDRCFSLNTETGIPFGYTIRGGAPATSVGSTTVGGNVRLAFFLTPNAALTARVRYFRSGDGVEMSADSDTPLCPVKWQSLILQLASALALEWEGGDALNQAKTHRASYDAGLAQAIAEDIAARGTDDEQLERRPVVRLTRQANESAATYDPAVRPYPRSAA